MITTHSKEIPDIGGIILLDCWETEVSEHLFKDKFYINLIEKIANIHLQWVVNSSSRLQIDPSDQSMATTMKVCNYDDNHPIIRNLLHSSGDQKTSALISKYLLNKRSTILISNDIDFAWFCQTYLKNSVENWLVAGHTWQMCTHDHGLGLRVLSRLTKNCPLNFYATDYSFCTMTEQTATLKDFEQDSMNWCQIENFGYQLLPTE